MGKLIVIIAGVKWDLNEKVIIVLNKWYLNYYSPFTMVYNKYILKHKCESFCGFTANHQRSKKLNRFMCNNI